MRFLYKRPNINDVNEELELVLDVLMSDFFIVMDLFWYSLMFTLFLFPVLNSLIFALVFFMGCYIFFLSLYFIIFKKKRKKRADNQSDR